jgi:hypothetical protein
MFHAAEFCREQNNDLELTPASKIVALAFAVP